MRTIACAVGLSLLVISSVSAQKVAVPNPSFEEGQGSSPASWTLSGCRGEWLATGAADGRRALAVTGSGADSGAWRSQPLPLEPGGVYRLSFRARSMGMIGGTPITGPAFCNRDLGEIPEVWTAFHSVFVVPSRVAPDECHLRFGQWQICGGVAFDAVELVRAHPVYARLADLALGEGEMISGNQYSFVAPLNSASRNHSRPLASHTCGFNSNRWTFAAGQELVYRHAVAGRRQTAAEVNVGVTWHIAGELVVEVSADGRSWQMLGTLDKVGGGAWQVPPVLLPAAEVWIRLRAQSSASSEKKPVGASLQVADYSFRATLDGLPITLVGETHFAAVTHADPVLAATIESISRPVCGPANVLVARVRNLSDWPVVVLPVTVVDPPGEPQSLVASAAVTIGPGAEHVVSAPYRVAQPGESVLQFALRKTTDAGPSARGAVLNGLGTGGPVWYSASVSLNVADLHRADYGERLPVGGDAADVWWCSSGWKVSAARPAPQAAGKAAVVRSARNETEAVQVVLRPKRAIRGLTVKTEPLTGPASASIPASCIEVLRVRYLMVTRPTDSTGCVGEWPDPLPPVAGPLDTEPDRNHPFWVRVAVPRDVKGGTYAGRIVLEGESFRAEVPLRVEVYDFALPDRMTCQTSFGFSPENVWQYQKLERAEDRRAVLDKYFASFSRHHISPYDPAPLDHFRVTWPQGSHRPAKGAPPPFDPQKFIPQFDWSAWDAAIERAIDVYHFNSFVVHVPGLGGGSFHARAEPNLLGWTEDAPQYKAALANYCAALESHLRAKGWLDEAYVYWFDEPDPKDYEFVMNGFRKLKAAAPDLTRMLTEQVEPGLVGGPNLWCPVTPEYNHERAEERRRHGERFWWYVCCGPKAPYATLFIDHPATELRVWLWQTWQRKIEGILIWQTNYWTSDTAYPDKSRPQNPYADPMSWVTGYGAPVGSRQPWGNGDGRFLYPPESAADGRPPAPVLEGPVESIRWEMIRDGIEDYEYLAILRRLLTEKGATIPDAERAAMESLLTVPDDITRDMTTFTKDPAPIERRRHQIARAIETVLGL